MVPEVSIVVPTYKRPAKLERALASIKPACSVPYEVLVVDDCPEGSAFEVAKAFAAVYVCKSGQNRGLSASRNIGIALSRAERLVFLDDDDFFSPGGLDMLYLASKSGASFAFGDCSMLHPTEKILTRLSGASREQLLVCNQIPVGAYMINRGCIRRTFDEGMRSHEDWEFILSNVNWSSFKHVAFDVVTIDKTENQSTSMQARRRSLFWLDFLSVYSRFPAPELSVQRQSMLAKLGLQIESGQLQGGDTI